jgi:CheY-like chemotaxis protein
MISPEEITLPHNQAVPPAKTSGGAGLVLLAEDDPALKRYLEVVLQRAGYAVVSASDGLEAMKLLLSNPVNIVVTDAVMPNLNGYELCRFVRSSQQLSHLPIVLLSALDAKNADAEKVDVFLPQTSFTGSFARVSRKAVSGRASNRRQCAAAVSKYRVIFSARWNSSNGLVLGPQASPPAVLDSLFLVADASRRGTPAAPSTRAPTATEVQVKKQWMTLPSPTAFNLVPRLLPTATASCRLILYRGSR